MSTMSTATMQSLTVIMFIVSKKIATLKFLPHTADLKLIMTRIFHVSQKFVINL